MPPRHKKSVHPEQSLDARNNISSSAVLIAALPRLRSTSGLTAFVNPADGLGETTLARRFRRLGAAPWTFQASAERI
jgi:hypothetical protein